MVELAAVADASAVPDAVVTALGLTGNGGSALTALRRARFKDLVVLLDNCEHVLDAAITAIVRRLDGLPLAIELAAAQVATLGIVGLAKQIDTSATTTPLRNLARRGANRGTEH